MSSSQLEAQEDYQVCMQMLARETSVNKAKKSKK